MSRILTNRSTYAVHRRIATAQYHNAFAFHADIRLVGSFAEAHDLLGVSNQEWQSVEYARGIFVLQPAAHRLIGADAEEYGIVILQQVIQLDVTAHFHVEFELNAHAGENFTATGHDLFLQLEGRNTEGQQTADFRVAVKDHRLHAVTGQHIGTGQACRAGTDDGDFFAGLLHAGQVRTPAHFERFIVDIAFDVADGHCTELIVQRTGTFTQTILWTDAAADFWQGVGLVRQLCCLKNTSLIGQLQPVWNVVMHRAFPLAVRVAAGQAAISLCFGLAFGKRLVNLDKFDLADLQRLLRRINALQVDKLINVLTHDDPLLRLHTQLCCATTTVTQQCFHITGFRFNQREFRGERRPVRQDLFPT